MVRCTIGNLYSARWPLFGFFFFRNDQVQHAIFVAGADLVGIDHILGELEYPLEGLVAELTTGIAVAVFLLILGLLFTADGQLVAIELDPEVVLVHAGSGHFHFEGLACLLNVDGRQGSVGSREVVESQLRPSLAKKSSNRLVIRGKTSFLLISDIYTSFLWVNSFTYYLERKLISRIISPPSSGIPTAVKMKVFQPPCRIDSEVLKNFRL